MDAISRSNASAPVPASPPPEAREAVRSTQAPQLMGAPGENGGAPPPETKILAVRSGLPPPESFKPDVEAHLRDALASRAALTRVGQVIQIEEPDPEPRAERERVELRIPGDRRGRDADVELRLPGAGRQAAPPAPVGTGRLVSTGRAAEQREDQTRAEWRADAREFREDRVEREVREESSERASEVASNTGAVQNQENRAAAAEEQKEAAGAQTVEASFTQAGVVEANRQDAIVTRFFEGVPARDPGPEPSPREELGERSEPVSYFA